MLRASQPTERTLMNELNLSYNSIKQREKFPEKLKIGELFRVAALLNKPLDEVFKTVLDEINASGRMVKAGVGKAIQ